MTEWIDAMSESRTIRDPFLGKDVQISSNLTDRLRGKYACGPTLPNGEPEFGWRQHETPPIQHEAAAEIDRLRKALTLFVNRMVEYGNWDDGCFYYNRTSATELQEPIDMAKAALASPRRRLGGDRDG